VKWIAGRRPSPAMVVALIALFVSLSGVSYGVATGFIDSREIKNNEVRSLDIRNNEVRTRDLRNNEVRGIDIRNSTINSRDVALNTLTGVDINEGLLGKVPSAAAADTAGTAGTANSATTADSVGGVSIAKLSWSSEIGGTAFEQIATVGGLTLEARCENAGGPAVVVQARTSVANSEISTHFQSFSNDMFDFDPGETFVVVDHVDAPGQITFAAPNGNVVLVEALAREDADDVLASGDDCGFFGFARTG
jgi:hypothetical protein